MKFWNEAFEFHCVECGAPPGYVAQPAPFLKKGGRLLDAYFLCEEHFASVQDAVRHHVRPLRWPERSPAEREASLPSEPVAATVTSTSRMPPAVMLDAQFRCPRCGRVESFSTSPQLEHDTVRALLTSFQSDVAAHLAGACDAHTEGPSRHEH